MLDIFDGLLVDSGFDFKTINILPTPLMAGEGRKTNTGRGITTDPSDLKSVPLAPPEGDAGTGMVATNAIRPRTGNISAGTSVFAMFVLEKPLEKVYPEIDIVTTPAGESVAMVHGITVQQKLMHGSIYSVILQPELDRIFLLPNYMKRFLMLL